MIGARESESLIRNMASGCAHRLDFYTRMCYLWHSYHWRLCMSRFTIVLLFAYLFSGSLCAIAQTNEADRVIGNWLVQDKKAKIKIYKKNNKFYGKIVWLKEPNDAEGKPKVDKENSEEELRGRKLIGLLMLKDFEYDEDLVWEDGEIYDPKNGKTYSCKMTMSEDGRTLDVRGYIGISLIGRSQDWTRTD